MVLRKINAVLSLVTTLLFIDHALFFSVWMLSGGAMEKSAPAMPRVLAVLMVLHGLISVALVLRARRDGQRKGVKVYGEMNRAAYLQRITGIGLLALIGFHVAGALSHFRPLALHAVVQPLFFAVAFTHIALSTGKAMITLGLGSRKAVRAVDMLMRLLCGAAFAASVAGFYLCCFRGGAV